MLRYYHGSSYKYTVISPYNFIDKTLIYDSIGLCGESSSNRRKFFVIAILRSILADNIENKVMSL